MTASPMPKEVKEFNTNVSDRFDHDQQGLLMQNLRRANKHKKMLLLHTPLTQNTLKLLESLKKQTPVMGVVYFGHMERDQRIKLEKILGDREYLVQNF